MSERRIPGNETDVSTVQENAAEQHRQKHAHEVQVLTCTLKHVGGTLAGMMLTGVAASVESFRYAQTKGEEMTVKVLYAHRILMDTLAKIDARLSQLDQEIAELESRHEQAMERSEAAFDRMHTLEDVLESTEDGGMTEARRAELIRLTGSKDAIGDVDLLILAHEQIERERQVGIDAQQEADRLREKIDATRQEKIELERSREEIMNDSTLSSAEKSTRLQQVLDRSLDRRISGVESALAAQDAEVNLQIDSESNEHRSELTDDDTFEMDESLKLDEHSSPIMFVPR